MLDTNTYVPEVKPNTKSRLEVLHHHFLLLLKRSYLYVSENKDGCVTDVGNPLLELIHPKEQLMASLATS